MLRIAAAATLSNSSTSSPATPSALPRGYRGSHVEISPLAQVHPHCRLGDGVRIGPFCIVGKDASIGAGSILYSHVSIHGAVQLGKECHVFENAVIGDASLAEPSASSSSVPLSSEDSFLGEGHALDVRGIDREYDARNANGSPSWRAMVWNKRGIFKTMNHRVEMGDGNRIGRSAVIGVACQDLKYEKERGPTQVVMGSQNDIREYVSVHLSSMPQWATRLGDSNLVMGGCHVAHDCVLGSKVILANSTLLAGHVVVDDMVHTGGAAAVHQFCQIGTLAFIAGGAMVEKDIPAYSIAQGDRARLRGLNAVGISRAGVPNESYQRLRKVYAAAFLRKSTVSDGSSLVERVEAALAADSTLREDERVRVFLNSLARESKRGICASNKADAFSS